MIAEDKLLASNGPFGVTIRRLLVRDGLAVLLTAIITLVVELGAYFLGLLCGVGQVDAVLAALAISSVWVALTCGILAAGGEDWLGALLRGGTVADASAVTLIVLWLATPYVTFLAAVEIYCTWVAMALLAVAAVQCARKAIARYAAALVTGLVLFAALSTPFWVGGLLVSATQQTRELIVTAAVYANPFYSITSAVVEQTHFIWHQAPIMYQITLIGDYVAPPPVPWYASAVICALGGGILAVTNPLRRSDRGVRPAPG